MDMLKELIDELEETLAEIEYMQLCIDSAHDDDPPQIRLQCAEKLTHNKLKLQRLADLICVYSKEV